MPPDATPETDPHADAAGWVLSALDPDDAQAFILHLQSCKECQTTVGELRPAAQAMGRAAPALEPPADLGARTLAAVQQAARRSAATVPHAVMSAKPSEETRAKKTRWWQRRWSVNPLWAVAALGATAGVVLAVAFAAIPGTESAPPGAAARPGVPVHAVETAARIPLHDPTGGTASGRAIVYRITGGWLIKLTVHGLPNLGPGWVYNCWYTQAGDRRWVSAGSFVVEHSGTESFPMTSAADPSEFRTMKIIAEHLGNPRPLQGKTVLVGTAANA